MSHCIRPAQQRQAAIAQHDQAADTQRFFNILGSKLEFPRRTCPTLDTLREQALSSQAKKVLWILVRCVHHPL